MRKPIIISLLGVLAFSGAAEARTHRWQRVTDKHGQPACRQKDTTVETVAGGVGGALLGNMIAGHGNRRVGTVIGAAGGAAAGHAFARRKRHNCPN
ncbi:MAG: glycine zipper 2TM domain-containing protein [Alphaproteobacteria bacterium]|nr:glycine zipper 2TM domain-containing protein [Alphaproteobacteria bacterium]